MLTADPEGFPLGLAELGLKKPKAGGENARGAAGAGPSPARGPRLGLADLPREGNEGLGWPEGRRGKGGHRRQHGPARCARGPEARSLLRADTDQWLRGWVGADRLSGFGGCGPT